MSVMSYGQLNEQVVQAHKDELKVCYAVDGLTWSVRTSKRRISIDAQ